MRLSVVTLILVLVFGWMRPAQGQDAQADAQYLIEAMIFRVTTNITGGGLTSKTLPGLNGLFHVIHEKWDDVELVMEGKTLTWDGKPQPDAPGIVLLSRPSIRTLENLKASIEISDQAPLQYFEAAQRGLYALRALEVGENVPGVLLGVSPRHIPDGEGNIELDFVFRVTTVTRRERLEGVDLNVGRPILGSTRSEGLVTVRDGEWACYRTPVESRGYLYVFMLVTRVPPDK